MIDVIVDVELQYRGSKVLANGDTGEQFQSHTFGGTIVLEGKPVAVAGHFNTSLRNNVFQALSKDGKAVPSPLYGHTVRFQGMRIVQGEIDGKPATTNDGNTPWVSIRPPKTVEGEPPAEWDIHYVGDLRRPRFHGFPTAEAVVTPPPAAVPAPTMAAPQEVQKPLED